MDFRTYIQKLNNFLKSEISTEHSVRGTFSSFLETLILANTLLNDKEITVLNEPSRIEVGAPDFVILKKEIPLGYIEAKKLGANLEDKQYKEQFERYINALDNLIITNYLDFKFYRNGKLLHTISLGKIEKDKIIPLEENLEELKNLIKNFISYTPQSIKSPQQLAKLMADKARLLKDVLVKALEYEKSTLNLQYKVFKDTLIHDIKKEEFADIYAQTIAFGMFIARYHDYTLEDFSRQEAQKLIPKSHPFLKGLFKYISDEDEVDSRIIWIIDELAEVFLAVNIRELFEKKQDPIIYFYEEFLSYYNPKSRKKRGVYYTPKEVVSFIVRSVDKVLKEEFKLEGLIDESKTTFKIEDPQLGYTKSKKLRKKEITTHKVQILDPATGTGTFLAEIVEFIKKEFFGNWEEYVNEDLLPRLNGFEILMAPYAIAHLKLDMVFDCELKSRINVYLTNALEPPHKDYKTLFAAYIAQESREADRIKKETPIMVIVGNPPYSVSSSNKNEFIEKLLEDYKKDLNERNIQPLSDDYIKFIRLAEYFIEKNQEGVIGYITNNSFLDGVIHRRMREHLLKTFDKIYVLNLHGNSRKKETSPDGSKDENIFDIQTGVSINIFVKTTNSKNLAKVFYADLWGKRVKKQEFLAQNDISSINWQKLEPKKPYFFFIPKNFELEEEYNQSFRIDELFNVFNAGVATGKDSTLIGRSRYELIEKLKSKEIDFSEEDVIDYNYRIFDKRFLIYDKKLVQRLRKNISENFKQYNIGLVTTKLLLGNEFRHIFLTNKITDRCYISTKSKETNYLFPLYLYNDLTNERSINFNDSIIKKIENSLNLKFQKDFNEKDLFNYIYAILHHPTYREKYKEFLKINFPKIPYPKDKEKFFKFAKFGEELVKLHLLDFKENRVIEYEGDSLEIEKINKKSTQELGEKVKIKINPTSSITIPKEAFNFYIGGYQVALKWLKDREKLNRKTLKEYNKIVDALTRTYNLMEELKKEEF